MSGARRNLMKQDLDVLRAHRKASPINLDACCMNDRQERDSGTFPPEASLG